MTIYACTILKVNQQFKPTESGHPLEGMCNVTDHGDGILYERNCVSVVGPVSRTPDLAVNVFDHRLSSQFL